MTDSTSNAELLTSFKSDGSVALHQSVHGRELTELLAHVDRFLSDIVPRLPPEQVFYEDKNDVATLKQIQHMGDYDPWFHDLFTAGRFREVAELLLDGPVVHAERWGSCTTASVLAKTRKLTRRTNVSSPKT